MQNDINFAHVSLSEMNHELSDMSLIIKDREEKIKQFKKHLNYIRELRDKRAEELKKYQLSLVEQASTLEENINNLSQYRENSNELLDNEYDKEYQILKKQRTMFDDLQKRSLIIEREYNDISRNIFNDIKTVNKLSLVDSVLDEKLINNERKSYEDYIRDLISDHQARINSCQQLYRVYLQMNHDMRTQIIEENKLQSEIVKIMQNKIKGKMEFVEKPRDYEAKVIENSISNKIEKIKQLDQQLINYQLKLREKRRTLDEKEINTKKSIEFIKKESEHELPVQTVMVTPYCTKLAERIGSIRSQLDNYQERKTSMSYDLRNKRNTINELLSKMKKISVSISNANTKGLTMCKELNSVETELILLNHECDTSDREHVKLISEISNLKKKIACHEAEFDELIENNSYFKQPEIIIEESYPNIQEIKIYENYLRKTKAKCVTLKNRIGKKKKDIENHRYEITLKSKALGDARVSTHRYNIERASQEIRARVNGLYRSQQNYLDRIRELKEDINKKKLRIYEKRDIMARMECTDNLPCENSHIFEDHESMIDRSNRKEHLANNVYCKFMDMETLCLLYQKLYEKIEESVEAFNSRNTLDWADKWAEDLRILTHELSNFFSK